ncbi:MAG: class I SAM-dependent methyltransferase [Verrucomicrobiota bacterium]
MSNYYNTSWMENDRRMRTPFWKRAIYSLCRPFLSLRAKSYLNKKTIQRWHPECVLISRGMPLETKKRWATKSFDLSQSVILIQGTGTGWDALAWARLKPRKIIGVDLFSFENSWNEIIDFCKQQYEVDVEFRQSSLENIAFLPNESIDICASENVFEHCQDLPKVMRESFRVLKPHGMVFASYGPLWYSAGGDHFSVRGGLNNCFNHLFLSPEEYKHFFHANLQETEDFQNGGRYVELDLFSKHSTQQYFDIYQQAGFNVDGLMLQLSPYSLRFREKYPEKFKRLMAQYREICTEDDFLIGTHVVRLKKK